MGSWRRGLPRRPTVVAVVLLLGAVLVVAAGADEGDVPPELLGSTTGTGHRDTGPEQPDPAPAPYALTESSSASVTCRFDQSADRVHVLRSAAGPRVIRAHGSWRNGTCPAVEAIVTVQLQAKQDGSWRDVGKPGVARVPSDHAGFAATDREKCQGRKRTQWRSLIDVDVVGHPDEPDTLTSPVVRLACCPPR